MRSEVETVIRSQAERLMADLDLVPREDFEAMRELAVAARTEAEELKERLEALEARVAKLETGA